MLTLRSTAVFTIGAVLVSFALVAQADKPAVAVFDFDVGVSETTEVQVTIHRGSEHSQVKRSAQTNLLTNKLIGELANSGAVTVVERDKTHEIMQEVQLSEADLTDPAHAVRIGKLLGAEYLVFGSITLVEPSVTVRNLPYNAGSEKTTSMTVGGTMRLVETETGRIQAAADLKASKSAKELHPSDLSRSVPKQFQDAAYAELADKISVRIVDSLSPIKVAQQSGNTLYLTRAGLDVGQQYEVVNLGTPVRHPDTGEILGQTETRIATIRITGSLQKMSKADVIEWQIPERAIPSGSICQPL